MKKFCFLTLTVCVVFGMITSCVTEEEQEEVTQLKGKLTINAPGAITSTEKGVKVLTVSDGTEVKANYAPTEGEAVTYEWYKVDNIVQLPPISIDPDAPVTGGAGGTGISIIASSKQTTQSITVTGPTQYTVWVRPVDDEKYGTGPLGIKTVVQGGK